MGAVPGRSPSSRIGGIWTRVFARGAFAGAGSSLEGLTAGPCFLCGPLTAGVTEDEDLRRTAALIWVPAALRMEDFFAAFIASQCPVEPTASCSCGGQRLEGNAPTRKGFSLLPRTSKLTWTDGLLAWFSLPRGDLELLQLYGDKPNGFLAKPYGHRELIQLVRELMN